MRASEGWVIAMETFADKLNYLFEHVRHPGSAKQFSNEEVAVAIGATGEASISGTYLWMLRNGQRGNPTLKHVEALASFFHVSPAYFFNHEQHGTPAHAGAGVQIDRIALRAQGLSPQSLASLSEVIERIRHLEGLPGAPPGRDAADAG